MQTARNRRSAEQSHGAEPRESGCRGAGRAEKMGSAGHGGVTSRLALPERNVSSRTEGKGQQRGRTSPFCSPSSKVLPSASPAHGHGEGATRTAARRTQMTPTVSAGSSHTDFFPFRKQEAMQCREATKKGLWVLYSHPESSHAES